MIALNGDDLKKYIGLKVKSGWKSRDFVDFVKAYWNCTMECVLGVGGLRGMGKTVGLLQSLPNTEHSLYICAEKKGNQFLDSASDIIKKIDSFSNIKNVIIDEYTWIKERETLDSALYHYIQNGIGIAITGTESMTLELLNYGKLSHRVHMLHCNIFTYEEYLRLYDITPDKQTVHNYLKNGGTFEEYAIDSFDSMKQYIKDGIIESLVSYLKNVDEEKATAIVYDLLYRAVCPFPSSDDNQPLLPDIEPMDSIRFYNSIGISPQTSYDRIDFARTVDILKKIQFIIEAENLDDTNATRSRYYIVNPSLNYQMYKAIYERNEPDNLLGEVFEAACVSQFSSHIGKREKLYFLKGKKLTDNEYEIDFIISDKDKEPHNSKYAYFFECKLRRDTKIAKDSSIEVGEIERYFPKADNIGRYVIYGGTDEIYAYLSNKDFIFAPLNSQLPAKYMYFTQQAEELKKQGKIYPAILSNPFYAEYVNTSERINGNINTTMSQDNNSSDFSVSDRMEKLRTEYFMKPKEDRKNIEWNGQKYNIAVFEDLYLAQCKKEGRKPDAKIKKHFIEVCVDICGYEPKHYNLDDKKAL